MGNEKYELFDMDAMPDDAPIPYVFDMFKNIDEDGNMYLPPCTGNTQANIDPLPSVRDLKKD